MTDLMARLDLPAVIVARSTLGTINHTLLTIEALRRRSLTIAGVVHGRRRRTPTTAQAIEQYGDVSRPRRDADLRRADAGSAVGAGPRPTSIATTCWQGCCDDASSTAIVQFVWHPYTQMKTAPPPLAIVRGQGVYLYTEDGRKLLDGISSWWVNIHGHAHPRLNQALADQAKTLEHVDLRRRTHEPAVELAERLVGILPAGLTRIFYSDNGSTAVEVAREDGAAVLAQSRAAVAPADRRAASRVSRRHVGAMSVSDDVGLHRAVRAAALPASIALHPRRGSTSHLQRPRRSRRGGASSSRCCRAPAA